MCHEHREARDAQLVESVRQGPPPAVPTVPTENRLERALHLADRDLPERSDTPGDGYANRNDDDHEARPNAREIVGRGVAVDLRALPHEAVGARIEWDGDAAEGAEDHRAKVRVQNERAQHQKVKHLAAARTRALSFPAASLVPALESLLIS